MFRILLPVFLIRIVGPSMEPSVKNGEVWLVTRSLRALRPGKMIVFVHPRRPNLMEVKRAVRSVNGQWWVEGDNPEMSTDSRNFGLISAESIRGVLIRKINGGSKSP